MKLKITPFIFVLIFSANFEKPVNAQFFDPLAAVNADLRAMFSPLLRPTPSKQFLYAMAAHVADSTFFSPLSPDTCDPQIFYRLYEELFNMAYDTTWLEKSDSVFNRALQFGKDTAVIGIMHFDYYELKPDALTTDLYFNFDTVNDIITDNIYRDDWPYIDSNIFTASLLLAELPYLNSTWRIDPDFIFTDAFTTGELHNEGQQYRVDFGDGQGWVDFNPQVVSHHNVVYNSNGYKTVKVAIFQNGVPRRQSIHKVYVVNNEEIVPPDEVRHYPGMEVGVYRSCNGDGLGKVVIYLEGFDRDCSKKCVND